MSNEALNWAWKVRLPAHAKVLLASYADQADKDGLCYPSIKLTADRTGLDRTRIAFLNDCLEAAGLLSINRGGKRRANRYALNIGKTFDGRITLPRQGRRGRKPTGPAARNAAGADRDEDGLISRSRHTHSAASGSSHITPKTPRGPGCNAADRKCNAAATLERRANEWTTSEVVTSHIIGRSRHATNPQEPSCTPNSNSLSTVCRAASRRGAHHSPGAQIDLFSQPTAVQPTIEGTTESTPATPAAATPAPPSPPPVTVDPEVAAERRAREEESQAGRPIRRTWESDSQWAARQAGWLRATAQVAQARRASATPARPAWPDHQMVGYARKHGIDPDNVKDAIIARWGEPSPDVARSVSMNIWCAAVRAVEGGYEDRFNAAGMTDILDAEFDDETDDDEGTAL